jgi:hypothetical protein
MPADLAQLLYLAAIESNGLGILANAHQAEAKIGFAFELVEVESDQDLAEHQQRHRRADQRIDDQKGHHFPGNRPENATEGNELQHGTNHHQQEVQGFLGKGSDVFGHALVRVVYLGTGIQAVIGPLAEIAAEKTPRQPPSPVQAELVAHVVIERIDRHGHEQDDEALLDRTPEPLRVSCRQCRGKLPGQLIEQHIDAGLSQQQHHQQGQQPPRRPLFFPEPVGYRDGPEALP